jgi:hypothetical protein
LKLNPIDRVTGTLFSILTLLVVFFPSPANAGWASNHCFQYGAGDPWDHLKRSTAIDYALVARHEGYQWGGGCWNDNDNDDQPNDPEQEYTDGEGGDCSGFTFKTWHLEKTQGEWGKRHWQRDHEIHGPYAAIEFRDPGGTWPIKDIWKINTVYMDAFASSGHIGMIRDANTSDGQDRIIEAKGEAIGTVVQTRNYRSDSSYEGVERVGWTNECYPLCA